MDEDDVLMLELFGATSPIEGGSMVVNDVDMEDVIMEDLESDTNKDSMNEYVVEKETKEGRRGGRGGGRGRGRGK